MDKKLVTEYTLQEKKNFAKNLTYLQKKSGLSTRTTVERLGYEQPNFYKWRTGQTFPSGDVLDDIADFYNTTVKELVGNRLPRQIMRIKLPSGLIVSAGTDRFSIEGIDVSSGIDDVKIERYNANTAIIRVALKGKLL